MGPARSGWESAVRDTSLALWSHRATCCERHSPLSGSDSRETTPRSDGHNSSPVLRSVLCRHHRGLGQSRPAMDIDIHACRPCRAVTPFGTSNLSHAPPPV